MMTQADAVTFAKEMAPAVQQIVDDAVELIERDGLKPLLARIEALEAALAEMRRATEG